MGLFGMLKEVASTISDMGQMTKLQDHLTGAITKLHADGQCPDEVWTAFNHFTKEGEELKTEKDNAVASKKSIAALHSFIEVLEKNEDKLPASLKDEVEKFAKTADEVEKLTKKFL